LLDIILTFICIDLGQFYSAVFEIFTILIFFLKSTNFWGATPQRGTVCNSVKFFSNFIIPRSLE